MLKKEQFRISESTFQIRVEEQQLSILKILTKIKRYFYSRATINDFVFLCFVFNGRSLLNPTFPFSSPFVPMDTIMNSRLRSVLCFVLLPW